MKKLLSILLCLLLLAGCAETYDGPTELKRVLDSTEEVHIGQDGEVYYEVWEDYSYDIYGNLAQTVSKVNGEPSLRTVYRYYEDGSMKSMTQYDLSGWFPRLILHGSYTYDDQGRQTGLVQWSGLKRTEQTTVYDDENRTVTTIFEGATTVVQLNEEGKSLRSETTHDDGTIELIEHEYRGNTHINRYYRNGELEKVYENTYDDQGRELSWTEIVDGERELIWRIEYGDGYEKKYYEAMERVITTGYNEDGTVKAVVETDENDQLTRRVIYRYTDIQVPAKEETP